MRSCRSTARQTTYHPVHAPPTATDALRTLPLRPPACADCWVPDYCAPRHFKYRLCKLRLHRHGWRKAAPDNPHLCPDGEYCEELECAGQCWLPPSCACETEHTDRNGRAHAHAGRMVCEGDCFAHASTQWGLCRPEPTEGEVAAAAAAADDDGGDAAEHEESPLPTGFHFWSTDYQRHNAKLHIDEGSPMARPRRPHASKTEL